MAGNLTIEAPDFARIKKESGLATSNAINLLWSVGNNEADIRSQTVRLAQETLQGKAVVSAVTTGQNNFDTQGCLTLTFTGASAFNITGFRNGVFGRVMILHNLGAGTITLKYESASS